MTKQQEQTEPKDEKKSNEDIKNTEQLEQEQTLTEQPSPETVIAELQQALAAAEQKAQENWDKAVRAVAEMENLKKRTQKDVEDAHKFALTGFAKELLSVLDSLELGLQAATGDSEEVLKFREGNELTVKQFETVFARFNIEAINPLGKPFDAERHQAMVMQEVPNTAPNTVVNVFQKGYMLNGRLLRPAMVVVAKVPEQKADAGKPEIAAKEGQNDKKQA